MVVTRSQSRAARLTLLGLPREIRDIIFGFLLDARYLKLTRGQRSRRRSTPPDWYHFFMNILLVNKQVREEGLQILVKNRFVLVRSTVPELLRVLGDYSTPMASTNARCHTISPLLNSMTINISHRPERIPESTTPARERAFLLLVKDLYNLRNALNQANVCLPDFSLGGMILKCDVHTNIHSDLVRQHLLEPLRMHGWHLVTLHGQVEQRDVEDFESELKKAVTLQDVLAAARYNSEIAREAEYNQDWDFAMTFWLLVDSVLEDATDIYPAVFGNMPDADLETQDQLLRIASLGRCRVRVKLRRLQEALDRLKAFLKHYNTQCTAEEEAEAYFLMGLAYQGMRRDEMAMQAFQTASGFTPDAADISETVDSHRQSMQARERAERERQRRLNNSFSAFP